jgi:hypothetical protein
MDQKNFSPFLLEHETEALCQWSNTVCKEAPPFEAARLIAKRLGGHQNNQGYATFGFWLPEVKERGIHPKRVFLEILEPLEAIDFQLPSQDIAFRRYLFPLAEAGGYFWAAIDGLVAGNREQVGVFYWAKCLDNEGRWWSRTDYLPWSTPFGAFAPAELYDRERLNRERSDLAYFRGLAKDENGMAWIDPSTNLLEIHPSTGCAEGSLGGLARIFTRIAEKIRKGESLTPFEENFAGYDGVQLMPIDPTVAFENSPPFFEIHDGDPSTDFSETTVQVTLRKITTTNWGYDVVISAMSAINPRLLESGRPDELVDFIAACHNFPQRPIKIVLDLVYGHADNQALTLLNRYFFAGPNMYGQNIAYRHPVVRAILLEMAERKMGFGADGLRVDGAQDFNYWIEEERRMAYDDEFLLTMGHQPIKIEDVVYRPWTIFEDGRPWPREDYQLASTYRALIEQDERAFQWGPLTFAHNTPFASTFWISKWWRLEESAFIGGHWISGVANHDTRRRGAQTDPDSIAINRRLGETLPEILNNAYDNIGFNLLFHTFLPGVPLDFINTNMRAPWGFIRNTDYRYAVKVMQEEWRSVLWQLDEASYQRPDFFIRLKELGFSEFKDLTYFMQNLARSMLATMDDMAKTALWLDSLTPPVAGPKPLDIQALANIARSWMDDWHVYANVAHHAEKLDPEQTAANYAIRRFRQTHPWLAQSLGEQDVFFFKRPVNGTVLIIGLRYAPDQTKRLLLVLNLEGETVTITPANMFTDFGEGWTKILPYEEDLGETETLANGAGFIAIQEFHQ